MIKTRVVNVRNARFDVYIGRGSKWGNPYRMGNKATREFVIAKYRERMLKRPDLMEACRRELKGKVLGCYCKPQACHGDVLAEIANGS